MSQIEAMKLALEALEKCMYPQLKQLNAITALRTAIEQAEKQEPVAYTTGHCKQKAQPGGCQLHNVHCGYPDCDRKAVATPPAAQRRIEELEALLERQTARIVDLQTHIENLEGEDR